MVHAMYYLGIHGWLTLTGYSPFWLRFPSAIAVGATAVLVVFIGRRLFSPVAGLLAGIAFATLPRVTWMGQEARSAAVATLALTVTIWLFLVAVDGSESSRTSAWREAIIWGAFTLAATVAVYIFMYTVLVLVILVPALHFIGPRGHCWKWFAASAAAITGMCAPFLMRVMSQQGQINWILTPTLKDLFRLPSDTWFGKTYDWVVAPWLVLAAALAGSILAAVRGKWPQNAAKPISTLFLLVGWLFFPALILITYSLAKTPIYSARYVAFTCPAFALLSGIAIASLARRQWVAWVAIACFFGLCIPAWWEQRQPESKSPSVAIAEYINNHRRPRDGVLFERNPIDATRIVVIAYPQCFNDMIDLNYQPPSGPTILPNELPLASTQDRLKAVTRVWVIGFSNPAQQELADRGVLSRAGFHSEPPRSFTGGWQVVLYKR